ncbi:MAG: protein-glutamate O-methyltransferase CheR [Gammaproteobacteria bacterium]|nr:protein-glutamate O-methyltransferase CheR [Gammaproteobacteria bacterium]
MAALPSQLLAGLPTFHITDAEFRYLRDLIYAHTGISLTEHKRALVCARLAKRLRHHNLSTFADYYHLITECDPEGLEMVEMINCITTNKTDFFREPHHFQFLTETVIPQLRAGARSTLRRLRVWSAGSSTGEEAYTTAITVREALADDDPWDVRILATDIDTQVLAHAERGVYTVEQASRIPEPLLQRYFYRGVGANHGHVRVKPLLSEIVQFRHLNLMDDPWPMRGQFDVIFCRNVVIYFDRETQRRLIERLMRMLRPEGYLFLGHSESIIGTDDAVRHVGQSIYQYKGRA